MSPRWVRVPSPIALGTPRRLRHGDCLHATDLLPRAGSCAGRTLRESVAQAKPRHRYAASEDRGGGGFTVRETGLAPHMSLQQSAPGHFDEIDRRVFARLDSGALGPLKVTLTNGAFV